MTASVAEDGGGGGDSAREGLLMRAIESDGEAEIAERPPRVHMN